MGKERRRKREVGIWSLYLGTGSTSLLSAASPLEWKCTADTRLRRPLTQYDGSRQNHGFCLMPYSPAEQINKLTLYFHTRNYKLKEEIK